MGGKRKAEDVLFDCHGCEPEPDETTVQEEEEDDDDEIISEEEYQAILAESRAKVDKEISEMFARLGLPEDDCLRYTSNSSSDEEEEDDDDE